MKTTPKKIINNNESVYESIAKKCETSAEYVGKINRGERQPVRGKGLKVYNELQKLK